MKKSKIFKLILTITNSVLCIALIFTFTYAWYTNINAVGTASFNILQIDSLVTMYQAEDSQFNGVPDRLTSDDQDKYYSEEVKGYISYSNIYYHEKYAFNYIDQRYALSSDSTSNLLNTVVITDAVPSKIYTFKFEITNYCGKENGLEFAFDNDTEVDVDKLSNFEVRLGQVNTDGTYTFTDWTSFIVDNQYSGITLKPTTNGLKVPAHTDILVKNDETNSYETKESSGRLDLWLQVRLKSSCTTSYEKYMLPQFRMTLSLDRTD